MEWGGSPISITHKLTVLVPPSIEAVLPGGLGQVDHPIEAREGSQVRLECRAEGIPPPIVRWRSPVSINYDYNWDWKKPNVANALFFGLILITRVFFSTSHVSKR